MAMAKGSWIVAACIVGLSTLVWTGGVPGAGSAAAATKARPQKLVSEAPMRIRIVRSADSTCEPNCPEWIAAEGQIVAGTLGQFRKIVGQLGARRPPVLIHSGGGLADEGIAIGRLLRSKGLDVGVGKTALAGCAAEPRGCRGKAAKEPVRGSADAGMAVCASACAFVLAGGNRRFVRPPAFVGVHQGQMIQTRVLHIYRMVPYRGRDGSIRVQRQLIENRVLSQTHSATPVKVYRRYESYFAEMGIARSIMPLLRETPNNDIHILSLAELRETAMATHLMSGDQLVRGENHPEDGWAAPIILPPVPVTSGTATNAIDCMRGSKNCAWHQFKPDIPVPPTTSAPNSEAIAPAVP